MMFGGDDEITHASFFGEADPFIRIECHRVEFPCDLLVIDRDRDLGHALDMLPVSAILFALPGAAQPGIDSPVDKHAETRFPPPTQSGVDFPGFR